jgi:PIN domain nuclease of toxin-antitoxin system
LNEVVLDASALIALLRGEPGSALVEKRLAAAVLGTVNLAEVVSKLIKGGMPENLAISIMTSLGLRIIDFNEELAQMSARLAEDTKHLGLSLGDRACLALAQQLKLCVLTADSSWTKLQLDIDVKLIR